MENAIKYAPQVARLIANNLDGVCIQFSRDISEYGDYECSTYLLQGMCNNTEKLEKWLKQEARDNGH